MLENFHMGCKNIQWYFVKANYVKPLHAHCELCWEKNTEIIIQLFKNAVQSQMYSFSIVLPENQCSGSVTFWYGSGSSDPYLWLTDPIHKLLVVNPRWPPGMLINCWCWIAGNADQLLVLNPRWHWKCWSIVGAESQVTAGNADSLLVLNPRWPLEMLINCCCWISGNRWKCWSIVGATAGNADQSLMLNPRWPLGMLINCWCWIPGDLLK